MRHRSTGLAITDLWCNGEYDCRYGNSIGESDTMGSPDNSNQTKHVESILVSLSGPGFESPRLHIFPAVICYAARRPPCRLAPHYLMPPAWFLTFGPLRGSTKTKIDFWIIACLRRCFGKLKWLGVGLWAFFILGGMRIPEELSSRRNDWIHEGHWANGWVYE